MKKLTIRVVLKMFSIAVVQTKVISCNSENKSYLLQFVHTKAIAALMQFCDSFNCIVKIQSIALIQNSGFYCYGFVNLAILGLLVKKLCCY